MKQWIASKKGSSTLLIALLLITLVVFGLLSITTTASELRLAKRNAESHKDFYALDSEGTKLLSSVQMLMEEASSKVGQKTTPDVYLEELGRLLDRDFPNLRKDFSEENGIPVLIVKKTFALDNGGYNKNLSIALAINAPGQIIKSEDTLRILEWRLWQEPFEYTQTTELWEGIP